MRKILRIPVIGLLLFAGWDSATAQDDDAFTQLLNGKDLSGWVVVNTAPSTWHFDDDGRLVCSGQPTGEIRTEKMYQNFILEVEWRHMKPRGNAGIFVWADDITARGQPFHRGVEVQVLENAYGDTKSHTTHGDIFPIHGAKMTPINGRGGSRAFPTEFRSNPSPEWNKYRIECNDGNISLAVNGKVVTQGKDASPRKGYICIESEGGIVHYRNMRIKELPDTPVDDKDVAIANRGYRSLYTGVDLAGWKQAKGWQSKNWVLAAEKGAEPLVSEETFGEGTGFIFDVRMKEETGSITFGIGKISIPIGPDLLENPKRWNRFSGWEEDGRWFLHINGVPRLSGEGTTGLEGPIRLEVSEAADWANIYVKDRSKNPE